MHRLLPVLCAALVLASSAGAATSGPVFGLRAAGNPKTGYFVYPLSPGATRTGAVVVSNVGTAAGTAHLFTADGTTGPTTGAVYKTNTAPTASGTWTTLSETSLRLQPGQHRTVPFTVHVPADAKPGQWVAGIAVEAKNKVATQKPGEKAHVQIKIRELTIVAVQVNVAGPPVSAFTIGNVTTGGANGFQKVFVHIANVGNLLAKPTGVVTIFSSSGTRVQALPFRMDTFLPQTAIDYPILLKKALPAGSYRAAVRLRVPAAAGLPAKVVTSSPSFTVSDADVQQVFSSSQPTQTAPGTSTNASSSSSSTPTWVYVAIAAAIVVVLILIALLLLRKRRGRKTPAPPTTMVKLPPEPAPAPEPETASVQEPEPATPTVEACTPYHYWDVDYEHGVHGSDGQWRFPHRCRNCGLEVLARDVTDASDQAAAKRP